jgi:aspartate/tyrosine/aromatic aminotransferase
VAQSFSKNFGLYGQRVGCLSVVTSSAAEKSNVESQLKILARAMYSNPPISGSRIVTTVLSDPKLRQQWEVDVKEMAERIIKMVSRQHAHAADALAECDHACKCGGSNVLILCVSLCCFFVCVCVCVSPAQAAA